MSPIVSSDHFETVAPAKINLFLEIRGRRDDGYHELRTLMCCVHLHDTLVLTLGTNNNQFTCSDSNLPCNDTNLAFKAALLFNAALSTETTIKPLNFNIKLIKRIPVGAGLGGGSSDAAAVLLALNRYYCLPLSQVKLHELALSLGADVPFFIEQRPAIATGIGEQLEFFDKLPPLYVVIVYPGFGISTAEVFKNLNLGLTKCEKQLSYSLFQNGKFDIHHCLCNDLELVVIHQFPIIEKIKKEILYQGAIGTLMTGSGSSVFGLFADVETARTATANLLKENSQWQVFNTYLKLPALSESV
jgi:4-diphosphocytidyl-2-C-methyl-D-erythritol kinase